MLEPAVVSILLVRVLALTNENGFNMSQDMSFHVFFFIVFQTMSQKLVSAELTQGSHSGFQLAAQEPQGGEGPPLGGRVLPETERERSKQGPPRSA